MPASRRSGRGHLLVGRSVRQCMCLCERMCVCLSFCPSVRHLVSKCVSARRPVQRAASFPLYLISLFMFSTSGRGSWDGEEGHRAAIASSRQLGSEAVRLGASAKERTKTERITSSASGRPRSFGRSVGRSVGCPQRWHDWRLLCARHPSARRRRDSYAVLRRSSTHVPLPPSLPLPRAHDPFHVFLLQWRVRRRSAGGVGDCDARDASGLADG